MKKTTTLFLLLTLIALPILSNAGTETKPRKPQTRRDKQFTVVIDAGHGGKDGGANAAPKTEKSITLAVALKLGKYIEDNMPDVKVIYTRRTDVFIELYERANIANRSNADLFISVHCNSLPAASPIRGTEVYVMGLHTADENLKIAKNVAARENQSILLEANYKKNYGGFDPNDPATHILLSMTQNIHIDQSIRLASLVNNSLKKEGQPTRGVHQAGFVVIRATACPSILVETGYLTSASENKILQSAEGQARIARGIYKAVKSYKNELEGKKKEDDDTAADAPIVESTDEENTSNAPQASTDSAPKSSTTGQPRSAQRLEPPAPAPEPVTYSVSSNTKPQKTKLKKIPKVENTTPSNSRQPMQEGTIYHIQIASSDKALSVGHPALYGFTDAQEDFSDGRYKYYTGDYATLAEAATAQTKLRKKGVKGAFVVKYIDGRRAN